MKVLFGPYGSVLSSLGFSLDPLVIKRRGQEEQYRMAVEMIARGYINAGATMPTVNAFFLRPLLKAGFIELYKEMLRINLAALLAALGDTGYQRIAISLGPANDCYRGELAPDVTDAHLFAKRQYELCIEVLNHFGLSIGEVVFLHETIGTGREALGLSQAASSLGIPLIVSFVVDRNGYLLSGETIEHVINRIDSETSGFVEGFSLNCCSPFAFDQVIVALKNTHLTHRLIGFYPNSYDADPCVYETDTAIVEPKKFDSLKLLVDRGHQYDLKFVGGCCGFGYYDIKLLASLVADKVSLLR